MTSTLHILYFAIGLLCAPRYWTRGTGSVKAEDFEGRPVGPGSWKASKWTLVGAIVAAYRVEGAKERNIKEALDLLTEAAGTTNLSDFNMESEWADVVQVLHTAIKKEIEAND